MKGNVMNREIAIRKMVGDVLFNKVYNKFGDKLFMFPASLKYHHSEEGGYFRHIHEVMEFCYVLVTGLNFDYRDYDSLIKLAFIHDLDKLERYEFDSDPPTDKQVSYAKSLGIKISEYECKNSLSSKIDNKKNGLDNPIQIYKYVDKLIADESAMVMRICAELGIELTHEEIHALCYHHGGWSTVSNGEMSPMATILHCADLMSSKVYK